VILVGWLFNGTSTQKGQFVPTAGEGNRLSRLRMANEMQCKLHDNNVTQEGRQQESTVADGVPAESLNDHYAAISTDHSYSTPSLKPIANSVDSEYITEWHVFKILDHLRPTATGLIHTTIY